MTDDFSDLKAGDLVVQCGRYGNDYRIVTVDRVTPTQAVIGSTKYRLANGVELGGDWWSWKSISRAPHLFIKAKQHQAADALRSPFPLSRAGVERARKAADYAESVLRETGQWDAPEEIAP